MSIEQRAERRYEDTMAERDIVVYGTLWTTWRDLPASEQSYWLDVIHEEDAQEQRQEPIYLTTWQQRIIVDAVILDPDPPWRERVLRIPGRHTARVERIEDSTPYLEGWLSDEEIALAIAERHPAPWRTKGRLVFDAEGRVVVGETCGAPSALVADWVSNQFNTGHADACATLPKQVGLTE